MNNIVRVAYQAMAAVLGGCQSLHTDSMDETLGLPTEQAVTVALRTQQILAHETGVTRVADPLGGSYFIEHMTDLMEKGALELIEEIDRMGSGAFPKGRAGVVGGIHKGYFRRAIAEASYRFSEECEAGDRIIVGVNEYVDKDEKRAIDILEIPHTVEIEQCERLAAFKKRRDKKAVELALTNIRKAAQNGDNVMPTLVEGALNNCTLGEMVQAMADIYGRYTGGPEW